MNNNFNNSTSFPSSPIVECNTTKNAYIGYHFDGWNGDAIWEGNEMCNHHYGMALTNNGEIGMQGSATQGSGNKWVDNVFVNCDPWPGFNALYHTYSENSNANQSFLWVIADQLGIPEFNPTQNAGNMTPMNYLMGPNPNNIDIAPVNRLMDCIYDPLDPIPPTWRLAGIGQTNTPTNSNKFRLYPNPTSSELIIESLESLNEVEVELYSIEGSLLYKTTSNEKRRIILELENLSAALYFVVIKKNGQTLYTTKVIKTQ